MTNRSTETIRHLVETFGEKIAETGQHGAIPMVHLAPEHLPGVASHVCHAPSLRGTLSLQWAVDLRTLPGLPTSGARRFELFYLFSLADDGAWLLLTTHLDEGNRIYPSITPRVHAAKWYEREIRDLFGLIAQGHPDLRRLVRHEHWPRGTHPLKKDFAWDQVMGRQDGVYHFRRMEGEGVFEVPVGPIHAGIIEPGHFRFSVAGEPVRQLEIRHFWKHRGVEKLFENLRLTDGPALAETVSGDSSFGHSLCYCQAAESLSGVEAPARAQWLRTLFLELERLHNHLGDVGAICNDAAYALALAHCGRMKEQLMQLNDRLTGSRFLRGVNAVGGVTIDLESTQLNAIQNELRGIEGDFGDLAKIIFDNASLTDRLETTGVLTEQVARDHGVVGVVGRASNINRDVRRDHPFAAYGSVTFKVPVYHYGDVRARVRVRVDEVFESMSIIRQVCARLSAEASGPTVVKTNQTDLIARAGDWALSAVEGWRGEILYVVMAGEGNMIHRCKVRDPSFVNWPAIQFAVLGNIIPDFPLINKSFNLS
ncbi:MAG: NADH-quinone oxidoreductase subunit C, partial [Nitrospirae bacterium]|nr:NADH-quinone oxidoreductase subunit C [Nitrospirota bacterium]